MLKTPDLDNHTPTLRLEKYSRATLLPCAITLGANKKSLHHYLAIWGKLTGAIRVPCLVLVGCTLKATRPPRGQLISTLAGLQRAALRPGIAPPPHFLWIRKAVLCVLRADLQPGRMEEIARKRRGWRKLGRSPAAEPVLLSEVMPGYPPAAPHTPALHALSSHSRCQSHALHKARTVCARAQPAVSWLFPPSDGSFKGATTRKAGALQVVSNCSIN